MTLFTNRIYTKSCWQYAKKM